MKIRIMLATVAFGITSLGFCQLSPRKDVDVPRPSVEAEKEETVSGDLVFKFTIKLITTVKSGQSVVCEADAALDDSGAEQETYFESASSIAAVSGSTATCTVNIPYSWTVYGPSQVVFNYTFSIGTLASTGLFSPSRQSYRLTTGAGIALPPSGTTTTQSFSGEL